MRKTIATVLVSSLVLMLAGPGWAAVIADYSYDCDVLPSAAGWTDINLEADIDIVDVGDVAGNKAIHWDTLTATTGYVGFNRELTHSKVDYTYEVRFKANGSGTNFYQKYLQFYIQRLGDVGDLMEVNTAASTDTKGLHFRVYDPNTELNYVPLALHGDWRKLRSVTDWNVGLTAYTVTWFYDDELAAGVGDDTDGFKQIHTLTVNSPHILDGSEWYYTAYDKFAVRTSVTNPVNHDESIDYIRWVDQTVDAGEALVPEPATMAVLALGGLAMLLRRRHA